MEGRGRERRKCLFCSFDENISRPETSVRHKGERESLFSVKVSRYSQKLIQYSRDEFFMRKFFFFLALSFFLSFILNKSSQKEIRRRKRKQTSQEKLPRNRALNVKETKFIFEIHTRKKIDLKISSNTNLVLKQENFSFSYLLSRTSWIFLSFFTILLQISSSLLFVFAWGERIWIPVFEKKVGLIVWQFLSVINDCERCVWLFLLFLAINSVQFVMNDWSF